MLSPTGKPLEKYSTPAKARLMAGAAVTPGKGTPGKAGISTPNRDKLVKITWTVKHDSAEGGSMWVVGNLPSLGSWDLRRGRKMEKVADGEWALAIYQPECIEFLYQYVLVKDNLDPDAEPEVLWEGATEKKVMLDCAAQTPGRQVLLSEDARGQASGVPGMGAVKSRLVEDALMTGHRDQKEEQLALKQHEIDELLAERERCANELQKLKDILQLAASPEEYRSRRSYVPDAGPLYDTVKGVQASIQKRLAAIASAPPTISEESEAEVAESKRLLGTAEAARSELLGQVEALRSEAEDARAQVQQLRAVHEAEKKELQEYYHKTMGEMNVNQKREVEHRMAQEESRTMLQSSLRVAAGELDEIKNTFCQIRTDFVALRDDFVLPTLKEVEESVVVAVSGVAGALEGRTAESEARLKKEVVERKRLHNLVQELKGNIRVFCRVRPLSDKNREAGETQAVSFPSDTEVLVENGGKAACFSYDAVFDPAVGQAKVFEETQPLVVSVLDGYNVCIFAYGQTGSGKTHTMQGYGEDRGVNTRALEELFALSAERAALHEYEIKVSLLEIYNETIRDLLEPRDEAGEEKKLDVKIATEGGTNVPGMAMVDVFSMEDVAAALEEGGRNRTVGRTNCNEHSSRSHMILSVYVKCCNLATGTRTFGKMHLIDLAGSERISRSGAEGDRLKEAQNINKSLSALGDCVQSLVSKSKHVPFRNSKLTYLLQDSLGGESKALMFVCASPCASDAPETLCSLNFASRVRNVELGPATKRKGGGDAMAEHRLREKEREAEGHREAARKAGEQARALEARCRALEADHAAACAEADRAAAAMAAREAEVAQLRAQLAARPAQLTAPEAPAEAPVVAPAPAVAVGRSESTERAGRKRGSDEGADGGATPRAKRPARVEGGTPRSASVPAAARSTPRRAAAGGAGAASENRTPNRRGGAGASEEGGVKREAKQASLEQRLAEMRARRLAAKAGAGGGAGKSVCFAASPNASANDSVECSRPAARPATAPARPASRLGGAARVVRPVAGGSTAAAPPSAAAPLGGARRAGRAAGGWRN